VGKNLVKADAKLTLNGPKCEKFRLRRALVALVVPLGPHPPHLLPFP
jgi:hypothetical protein